jgi:hypothetical protein
MAGAAASIISYTDSTVVLKYGAPGTFDWSNLTCTVTNSCGSTTLAGSGSCIIASSTGEAGDDLVIGDNRYRTWIFPEGLGRWTIDGLRELPAYATSASVNPDGIGGYYYTDLQAKTTCPHGWSLPKAPAVSQVLPFLKMLSLNDVEWPLVWSRWLQNGSNSSTVLAAAYWVNDGDAGVEMGFSGSVYFGGWITWRSYEYQLTVLCVQDGTHD